MAAGAAAILFLTAPSAALGHAQVISIEPADGAVVPTSPGEISVAFSESVQPLQVRLVDDAGTTVKVDFEFTADQTLRVTPPRLANGLYLFSFRVASADGHPIARATTFQIGTEIQSDLPVPTDSANSTGPAFQYLLRFIATAMVLMAIGVFLYRRVFADSPFPLEATLYGAAVALATLSFVMFLPEYSGSGLAVYRDSSALGMLLTQRVVIGQALYAGGFLLFAISALRRVDLAALAGLAALLVGKSLTGHTVTAIGAPWPSLLLVMHLLLVAFWLGSLAQLHYAIRREGPDARVILAKFSGLAMPAVLLLLISGGALFWLIFDDWQQVLTHPYSQLLLLKIFVVSIVCVIAIVNKQRLTPRLERDDGETLVRLRKNIRWELILLLCAVAITTVLAVTAPAAFKDDQKTSDVSVVFTADNYELSIRYAPFAAGHMMLSLQRDGEPINAMELALQWRQPNTEIEALRRDAKAVTAGFEAALPPISADIWLLQVDILIDDFTSLTMQGRIELR